VLLVFAVASLFVAGVPQQPWLGSRTPTRQTGWQWHAPITAARTSCAGHCILGEGVLSEALLDDFPNRPVWSNASRGSFVMRPTLDRWLAFDPTQSKHLRRNTSDD
jgi:hypothetical protein